VKPTEEAKKENTVKIAQNYLQSQVATLLQPLGSLCKEISLKILALTRDIDQRISTIQKMDCNDPNIKIPRSVNIKVSLKAPDNHRAKEVFKNKSAEFDTLVNDFKASATKLMKENAEETVKTLQEERFTYLVDKMLILSECFYAYYKIQQPENAKIEVSLDSSKIAQLSTRFFFRKRDTPKEIYAYLDIPTDEARRIVEERINPGTFTDQNKIEASQEICETICNDITRFFKRCIINLKKIIKNGKRNKQLNTELTSIINKSNIQNLTEIVEEELEKEDHLNSKQTETVIDLAIEKKMKENMKLLAKRMAKTSLGGGKNPPSKPEKSGKSTSEPKDSRKQKEKKKSKNNQPKKNQKPKKKDANQSRGASSKGGKKGKEKRNRSN